MTVIGITGGTGAGKTTALRALSEIGALVIDCDRVYHGLLETLDELKYAIAQRFGSGLIVDGILDRKALGRCVFNDAEALSDLNGITNPRVENEVRRLINASAAPVAAIDAIGLFESGIDKMCDITVFVTAPQDIRAKRIVAREGITLEYAYLRINAQKDDEFYKSRCDYTLVNDFETEEEFRIYCKDFFEKLLNL